MLLLPLLLLLLGFSLVPRLRISFFSNSISDSGLQKFCFSFTLPSGLVCFALVWRLKTGWSFATLRRLSYHFATVQVLKSLMRIRVASQGNWWRFLQNDFRLQSRFEWLIMHSFKWPAHVAARDVLSKPLLSIFIIVSSRGRRKRRNRRSSPLNVSFAYALLPFSSCAVSVFVFLTLEWHKNTHTPTHT